VDFRPAATSDHGSVKAVIDELVILLRGTQPAPAASADVGAAVVH
jgi:hypothetical protein